MAVKAKFVVHRIESSHYSGGYKADVVYLGAVNGPGNEDWAAASPGGNMQLIVTNKAALEQFKPGAEFLLTFEHAPCVKPDCDQLSGHDSPCGKTT